MATVKVVTVPQDDKPCIRVAVEDQRSTSKGGDPYRHYGLPFPFKILEFNLSGLSTEPLLDACRMLKDIGVDPNSLIGLYSPGAKAFRMRTTVGYGAHWSIGGEHGRLVPYEPKPDRLKNL
jgi:hypothetical protein